MPLGQPETLICLAFLAAMFGAICGILARIKGRNVPGWAVLGAGAGLLCGIVGIVPVIIIACLPNMTESRARDAYQAEENRRLREQLRQERIKSESFRQHAAARLDAHDKHLGLDTRDTGPLLAGSPAAGELGPGDPGDLSTAALPRWYYGRQGQTYGPLPASQVGELIRTRIITRETLLWSEDMSDWTPAGDIALFATQFT